LEVKDFVEKLNIYVVFIQGGSLEKRQFGKEKLE
jgi:hypothetical protein